MVRNVIARSRALRSPVAALVGLFWIYTFGESLTNVFIQIFLFQLFANLKLNVIAAILSFTGIAVGFCGYGYIASVYKLNIKHGFTASFVILAVSFALLSRVTGEWQAFGVLFINGIGDGLFWLTVHTFELFETHDHERDFYSSLLAAGGQIFSVLGPALATFLIWISGDLLHFGAFTLLFLFTPLVYATGFLFFNRLRDYHPQKIERVDLIHFIKDKKNQSAQPYLFGGGAHMILFQSVIPLTTLFILGGVLHVGVYNTIFAIFSTLCLLFVSEYRHAGNRVRIMAIAASVLAILLVFLGYSLTFVSLVVFTVGASIFLPLKRVSDHVVDLQTMESIGRAGKDFYATMIFRDVSLWIWRTVAGLIFLGAMTFLENYRDQLSLGLYLNAAALIFTVFAARFLLLKLKIRE